jgi:hypothetical protein
VSDREEKRDVLDVLYGEGGDEAELDEAAKGELAKWRELRGVMREVSAKTDAEPPDTMAILMAAAREHKPEPKGLWARLRGWFTVMLAHPAMSAAATVVIVGGVAGALYVSGAVGSKTHERAAATEKETAGAEPPAPAPVAPTEDHAEGQAPPPMGSAAAAGSAAGSGSAAPDTIAKDEPARAPQERHEIVAPKHKPAPPAPAKPAPKAEQAADGLTIARGDEGGVANGEIAPPAAVPPPPPPAPPPEPAPAPAAADEEAPVAKNPAAKAPAPAGAAAGRRVDADKAILTRQAKAAAKQKDCKTVDALATRVIQLDEGYYRANFATDPDIRANCDAATRK